MSDDPAFLNGREGWGVSVTPWEGARQIPVWTLLGVRLTGPAPIECTYLPLSAKVHAIYGPNGIGKTKVLEGLRALLTGEALKRSSNEPPCLFAQMSEGAPRALDLFDSDFNKAIQDRLYEGWKFDSDDSSKQITEYLLDLEPPPGEISWIENPLDGIEVWLRIKDAELERELSLGLDADLAKEIAHSGYLAATFKGFSPKSRRRDIYDRTLLCLDEQSASPKLREAIAETFKYAGTDDLLNHGRPTNCLTQEWPRGKFLEQQSRPSWAPIVLGELEHEANTPIPLSPPCVIWVGSEVEYFDGVKHDSTGALASIVEKSGLLTQEPVGEALPEEVTNLLETANRYYETIIGKPIEIGIEVAGILSIFRGTHPRIVARDLATSQMVPLAQLSATESRWVQVAFLLAWHHAENLYPESTKLVLLIDEPELGLAREMQRQLSSGLVALSKLLEMAVFASTHSPALLDHLDVSTFRCSRNDTGNVQVDEVLPTDRDALKTLGVPISEELHLYKLILIVEGRHEQILLDEMFASEIAASRIKLLPIRGVRQLRLLAADTEVLFRYISAPFVVLTDRTRTQAVTTALEAAQAASGPEESRRAIEAVFDPSSDEEQVLRSLLISAAESKRLDRIQAIHGFEKDDILHYLPSDHFVSGSEWEELFKLHKERTKGPKDFKRWLELTEDVDLSDDHLRNAIHKMDEIPVEWTELISRCTEIAREQAKS